MKFVRAAVVTVIAIAVLVVSNVIPGRAAPESIEPRTDDRPTVDAGLAASTWMCAAPSAPGVDAVTHTLILTNRGGQDRSVVVTGFATDGKRASATVSVPRFGTVESDAAKLLNAPNMGLLVEAPGGDVVAAHRLSAAGLASQQVCATSPSDRWYFPAASTTRGTSTRLVLFNPFPADATVDVQVATDSGVRTPQGLSGIPVAPGSIREIDLGAAVQRRDQFSFTVASRSGRVVAELVEVVPTTGQPGGLAMLLGAPSARTRLVFADGYTGGNSSERLVVFNPGPEDARVSVQVLPFGMLPSDLPDPFTLEVPALRYGVLDLSAETRLPPEGAHSIVLESPEQPVVAVRVNRLSGAPTAAADPATPARPQANNGVSMVLGTPSAATRAVVPAVVAEGESPYLLLHNPGSGIAVVNVRNLTTEGPAIIKDLENRELVAGESLYIPLVPLGLNGRHGLLVESAAPVITELRQSLAGGTAIVGVPAVADRDGLIDTPSPLEAMFAEAESGPAEATGATGDGG